ncbi:DUF6578 domain-containing protein [Streptomyces sp. NPDC006309]|uniref:DUF6578 domain-containing protein n=1 Tax=Streptomyces sp. NPDC006309 TaxID=3156749 RepID=UPI0033B65DC5
MARARVFYENWQMECCGTPFAVGDEVAWRLAAYGEAERRENTGYGAEARVENHLGPEWEALGRVHAIELVHQEYLVHTDPRLRERLDRALDPDPESGGVVLLPSPYRMEEVPGAWTLEPVTACPKWFESEEPGREPGPHRVRRTEGVLVTLDVTGVGDVTPEDPGATPDEPGDRR